MLLSGLARHASAQWEMIGPDGSPDEIFRVDSFLYGTTTYGFYRSSDDGDSWKRLDKGLPQPLQHTYEVKYDGYEFSMPARTFTGVSGDSGFYVLDANDVWQYVDSSHNGLYGVYSNRISGDSFVTIFRDTAEKTFAVHLTTDKGQSWSKGGSMSGQPDMLYLSSNRIILVVDHNTNGNQVRVYDSEDFGGTWGESSVGWALINKFKIHEFSIFLHATALLNGNFHSLRSTNNGITWEFAANLDGEPTSVSSVGSTGFAFLYEYAYRSTNFGESWNPVRTQDQKNIHAIVGNNRGDGYVALVEGSDFAISTLYHLDTNFAIVRPALNQKLMTTDYWLVHADESVVIAMGGIQRSQSSVYDTVYRSTENGSSWELRHVNLSGIGITGTPWKRGQQYLYTVGKPDSGHYAVYRSSDHGEHWENIGPRHDSIFFGPVIKALTNDTIVVDLGVPRPTRFYVSHDGGTTWGGLYPNLPDANRKLCFHNGYLYDLQLNPLVQLLRSPDGIVWGAIDLPATGDEKVTNIFSAEGILYAVTLRYISSAAFYTLYRSDDEGASWSKLTDQLGGELRTPLQIIVEGSTTYLVGENSISPRNPDGFPRLYASSDRGATWKRLNTNIPEANEFFVTGSDLFVTSARGGSYRLSKERAAVRREAERADELVVYPNPATQQLTVTHPPGLYTYTIVSMAGVPMRSQTSPMRNDAELDISGLPAGMYCLRVHNERISMQTLFVVVR